MGGGRSAPLVGIPADGFAEARRLQPGQVALGPALAARLGARAGDAVPAGRERWRVAAVLPSTGSAEDLVAWAPLAALQDLVQLPNAVNAGFHLPGIIAYSVAGVVAARAVLNQSPPN